MVKTGEVKHAVVVTHSQVNNKGHVSGQAICYHEVQNLASIVSRLCDKLKSIQFKRFKKFSRQRVGEIISVYIKITSS